MNGFDMNYLCIFAAMPVILLASSCNKIESLSKDREALEAEFLQSSIELQGLDTQYAALDAHASDQIQPEQQHAEWVKKNTALQQKLADLSKTCTQGDELLKKVRSKLEAYKALSAQ